jgi:hypothetical protein
MDHQVTCPSCRFVFVVVPGLGLNRVDCPRCSQAVLLTETAPTDWVGDQTTGARQRFQTWGRLLWVLAVPLLFCCVAPTWLGESWVRGGRSSNPFPYFSTVMTGLSALTLLATGIALTVVSNRLSLERLAQLSERITLAIGLLTALAAAGFIFGVLRCPQ